MAEYCFCCGKKVGIFTGSHLDNTVCDTCYFKFAGYVEEIKNATTMEQVEDKYIFFVNKIKDFDYAEEGNKRILAFVDEQKKEKLEQISELEQDRVEMVEKQEQHEKIAQKYKELRKNIMLTTCFEFSGYDIIKYCGVESGNAVLGTGFLSEMNASLNDIRGTESNRMSLKIEEAKLAATTDLINKCIYAGGNAIVGVSYNMMTLGSNMIAISANGTAVFIKKKTE